jgi:hypothetical protein
MQKILIELENKIHSLQLATQDDRDKFIFQICRQLINDKINIQNCDNKEISDSELQEMINVTHLSMYNSISKEYQNGYRHGLEHYHNTLKRKNK